MTAGLCASGAQARILNLTDLLTFSSGGFSSSMIHNQRNGRMSGGIVARFNTAITDGTYDTDTGEISFNGSIYSRGRTNSFSASGNLSSLSSRENGVHGNIVFNFSGRIMGNRSINFEFADQTYNNPHNVPIEPNRFSSNGDYDYISLWGDRPGYRRSICSRSRYRCYGMDLRIAYEDGGDASVVPLPASGLLLLAGIGGLGVTRRLRKKA